MRVIVADSTEEAVALTVARVAEVLRSRSQPVLGLATGSTMEPVYAGLVAEHRRGLSFTHATSFNLDEYVGLPPEHPQSYRHFMQKHLFAHVDMAPERIFVPRGDIDPGQAVAGFEAELAARGPVHLQLLGIGPNGHVAFNEPGSSLASHCREVVLSRATLSANARFFGPGEEPPRSALTMGVATILSAERIVLLALGEGKAEALRKVAEGPVTAMVTGSALQMHNDATLIADPGAASRLELIEDYRIAEAYWRTRDR